MEKRNGLNYAFQIAFGITMLVLLFTGNANASDVITKIGEFNTGNSEGVAVAGNYAYLAEATNGLVIINISNPVLPTLVGSYSIAGYTNDVVVVGNYAYVAAYDSGLVIINISNPVLPTLVGSYNTVGRSITVAVMGNYAYLADDDNGLVIVDVSNPAVPTLKGSYNTGEVPWGVTVVGNYAYMANWDYSLVIVNVSNPAAPTFKGRYNTSGHSHEVAVVGNYAYVAGTNGLEIVDVKNPETPTLVGSYDTSGLSLGVTVVGNYTYLADYDNGFVLLDVSNPEAPLLKASYDTAGLSYKVAVVGNLAYVAQYNKGLEIFQIDTTRPIPANVEVNPKTLNKASHGGTVTVYIKIPGYKVNDIDVRTVKLKTNRGEVSALLSPKEEDDSDGHLGRMVKFDRDAVIGIVDVGNKVKLTISGMVSGIKFEGTDEIRVMGKEEPLPPVPELNTIVLVSAGLIGMLFVLRRSE